MSHTENITTDKKRKNSVFFERMLAVQCCYACIVRDDYNINRAILDFSNYNNYKDTKLEFEKDYYTNLVKNALDFYKVSDKKIESYLADNWSLSRLPKVILAILIIGCYEICNYEKKDIPIIIDDFLEISKSLNHAGELGFINSVLDKIAKEHFDDKN